MTHRLTAPTWLIAVVILATYAAILAVLVAWAAGRTIPVDDLRVPDATAPPPAADRQQNPLGVWGFEVSAPGASEAIQYVKGIRNANETLYVISIEEMEDE